jgi:CheY-like chemotaxis protein
MTTSFVTLPLSEPGAAPARKKRVLLVDASSARRELRSEAFRKLGIDVDCAADIVEARAWWRADLYSLVLMDVDGESGRRDKFCADLRTASPPQQLAFLVGKPEYLSDAPNANGAVASVDEEKAEEAPAVASESLPATEGLAQRWGILEASRRISAVRSLAHARIQALRDRPTPPRDLESRHAKRVEAWSNVLPELQKEEMQ